MGVEFLEMYWMQDNLNISKTYIDDFTFNFRKNCDNWV